MTRKRSELLFNANQLLRPDIERIYSGLFLEVVTHFEDFLDTLFIGIFTGTSVHPHSKVKPRFQIKSPQVCRQVVTGPGKNYADWLPYDRTMQRAEVFLKNEGFPFTILDDVDKSIITQILWIRNAIAHSSIYSYKKFKNNLLSGPHTNSEERPGGYLRYPYVSSPTQTHFERVVFGLLRSSKKLSGHP